MHELKVRRVMVLGVRHEVAHGDRGGRKASHDVLHPCSQALQRSGVRQCAVIDCPCYDQMKGHTHVIPTMRPPCASTTPQSDPVRCTHQPKKSPTTPMNAA